MPKMLCAAAAAVAVALALAPAASAAGLSHAQIKHAQVRLAELHFEVGPADGVVGPMTARAMCGFEFINKLHAHLGTMSRHAYRKLMRTQKLRRAAQAEKRYLAVSTRCQVLYEVRHHHYQHVIPASTGYAGTDSLGRPSSPTWRGRRSIYYKHDGWQESNEYSGGMMYRPMYLTGGNGGEAIHGEASASSVLPYYASHGCVRVFMKDQDRLWRESPEGTVVYVE